MVIIIKLYKIRFFHKLCMVKNDNVMVNYNNSIIKKSSNTGNKKI